MSRYYVGQFVVSRGPLAELTEGFAEFLFERGYSPSTVEAQMRMMRDLSGWMGQHRVDPSGLDEHMIEEYVGQRRLRTRALRSARGLLPLLGYLRDQGTVPAVVTPSPVDDASGVILEGFEVYLRSRRGLSEATINSYLSQVRPFVSSVRPGAWGSLSAEQANSFIDQKATDQRPRSVQVRITALRALLRWLWLERIISAPVHQQVLSMFAPAGPPVPRGLTASQVAALRGSLSADPVARVRDVALVALMLRLALRAGEAASLTLEDLDWRAGTLIVAGKAGRIDRLPLPNDVAHALITYLRSGRPTGTPSRRVFLAIDAPHLPINASTVSSMVARALRRAGIPGTGAAHRLRHSASMGVITAGGGMVEAGQLLRHSSVSATAVYARADVAALAVLARPWPGVTR